MAPRARDFYPLPVVSIENNGAPERIPNLWPLPSEGIYGRPNRSFAMLAEPTLICDTLLKL